MAGIGVTGRAWFRQRRRDEFHDDRNYDELEGKPLQVLSDRPDQRSRALLEHHHPRSTAANASNPS